MKKEIKVPLEELAKKILTHPSIKTAPQSSEELQAKILQQIKEILLLT